TGEQFESPGVGIDHRQPFVETDDDLGSFGQDDARWHVAQLHCVQRRCSPVEPVQLLGHAVDEVEAVATLVPPQALAPPQLEVPNTLDGSCGHAPDRSLVPCGRIWFGTVRRRAATSTSGLLGSSTPRRLGPGKPPRFGPSSPALPPSRRTTWHRTTIR